MRLTKLQSKASHRLELIFLQYLCQSFGFYNLIAQNSYFKFLIIFLISRIDLGLKINAQYLKYFSILQRN